MKFLNKNIKLRVFQQFLSNIASSAVFPFMVVYLSKFMNNSSLGLILISSTILSFLATFIGGYISDKYGRLKILKVCEIFKIISFLIIVLPIVTKRVPTPLTVIGFVLSGTINGFSKPPGDAYVVDSTSIEERSQVYSILYWTFNISLFLGGLIGTILFMEHTLLSFMLLIISSIISLLIFSTMEELYKPTLLNNSKRLFSNIAEFFKHYSLVLKDKLFIIFMLASIFDLCIEVLFGKYTSVMLARENVAGIIPFTNISLVGAEIYGVLNTINTIVVIVGGLLIVRILKNKKKVIPMVIGILFYTIGYSLINLSFDINLLFIAISIASFGELIYVPIKQSILANLSKGTAKGSYMAANTMTIQLSSILGSLILITSEYYTTMMMSGIILILGLSSLFLYLVIYRKEVIDA